MRTLLPVIFACGILPSVTLAQEVEFSFGALIASDYISDGESLSGDKPVLQGYVELQYGRVYVGVWASTLDDGTDTAEADVTIGYRQSIGDVDIDINYARTIYDKSGDCCGEFAIYAEYPLTDDATLGGGISFDTISDETSVDLAAAVDFAEAWTISGGVGADFDATEEDEDSVSWDIGLIRSFGENSWGDIRFFDSSIESSHVIVSVGFDF
ncbi:TorF family putative porin [Falsirhodobacter xinxiangensis]|uniref:TorF family putative porin n=1 Tax=Falsirhodobacter xinxiangensis TaxID=2530049 RepID=UPI0010AB28B0|nr:TorF family putative porin [Rhodobacter xinxiangensis]